LVPSSLCLPYSKLYVYKTEVFYAHGATFNKAAALCEAYYCASPSDWVLHFDSDILPPEYWRRLAEKRIQPGNLYGAFRYSEDGKRLDEYPLFPYGYFHLWNTLDPNSWNWPIFEHWHPHAGNYDSEFAEQWPMSKRLDLGFSVTHQGEPRENWMGPKGGDMQHLREVGLWKVRQLAKQGVGILDIPVPDMRLLILDAERDPIWTREVLRSCAAQRFDVTANTTAKGCSTLDRLRKVSRRDFTQVDPGMPLNFVQELIRRAKDIEVKNRKESSDVCEPLQPEKHSHSG
jgi:hypothetical protein